jgi:predicted AAA+ superfamily ATPase
MRLVPTVIRLDNSRVAQSFRDDPDAALRLIDEPAVLDEWQEVDGLLGAVKRAVDQDSRPGRFILTGSVTAENRVATWPATGRVVDVPMEGFTVQEVLGRPYGTSLADRLLKPSVESFVGAEPLSSALDLGDYLGLALRGTLPSAVLIDDPMARTAWLRGYLDNVIRRDIPQEAGGIDPARLGVYIEALATTSAEVVEDKTLYDSAGIAKATARAYDHLLSRAFISHVVPAWSSNRLKRLVQRPKRYLLDASLVAAALGADLREILLDAPLLGRVMETFVAGQVRAALGAGQRPARLFHLRTEAGRHEVDIVVAFPGGKVAGIEVKSTGRVSSGDARHLEWMRDGLGDRFTAGVVLHTGPAPSAISDRVFAAPISTLWAPAS